MAYCRKCGNQIDEQDVKCPECGESLKEVQKGNIGFAFLGFFIPVVGFVLFFAWNKERPQDAKYSLIGAIIAIPLFFIFTLIFAVFFIPAVGAIISNTEKSLVYADALAVEQAADLYCTNTLCADDEEFTLSMLEPYIEGSIDEDYYELNASTVVAYLSYGNVRVRLEASGTGNWEFMRDEIPSQTTREASIFEDVN